MIHLDLPNNAFAVSYNYYVTTLKSYFVRSRLVSKDSFEVERDRERNEFEASTFLLCPRLEVESWDFDRRRIAQLKIT